MWICLYAHCAYKKVGVVPTRIVKSNVSSIGPSSEKNRDEGPRLKTLDFTIRIGTTRTFTYTCYSAHSLVSDAQIIDEHFLDA